MPSSGGIFLLTRLDNDFHCESRMRRSNLVFQVTPRHANVYKVVGALSRHDYDALIKSCSAYNCVTASLNMKSRNGWPRHQSSGVARQQILDTLFLRAFRQPRSWRFMKSQKHKMSPVLLKVIQPRSKSLST
jgi:hypothetical protein